MEEKLCTDCNTPKSISFFPGNEWKKPEGNKRRCCACASTYNREKRETSRLQGKGPRSDWNTHFVLANSNPKRKRGQDARHS